MQNGASPHMAAPARTRQGYKNPMSLTQLKNTTRRSVSGIPPELHFNAVQAVFHSLFISDGSHIENL